MNSLILCIAICSSFLGDLWLPRFERKAVYPFDSTRVDPADLGLVGMSEVVFTSSGQRLILWVAPARSNQPTILYLHGNAGNLANRTRRFQHFIERGYGVIAPAYRGSSGSTGRPSEAAITSDIRRVYNRLDRLVPGLRASRTIVYGESLGTGVALKLLAGDNIPQPRGVVLEAPYTSLPDVVMFVYPQFEPLIPKMKNIWNSAEHVKQLQAPLFVMHGSQDTIIPLAQGRAVFDAAGSRNKQFLRIPGASHSETWRSDTLPKLWRFIDGL